MENIVQLISTHKGTIITTAAVIGAVTAEVLWSKYTGDTTPDGRVTFGNATAVIVQEEGENSRSGIVITAPLFSSDDEAEEVEVDLSVRARRVSHGGDKVVNKDDGELVRAEAAAKKMAVEDDKEVAVAAPGLLPPAAAENGTTPPPEHEIAPAEE